MEENNNTALAEINRAQQALERANDIHEILDLRDKAAAFQLFANAQGFKEAAQEAKIYQLKAERKAGDWLKDNVGTGEDVRWHDATALPDGVDKYEAYRWRLEASVPEEIFNDWIDDYLSNGKEISAFKLRRIGMDREKELKRDEKISNNREASKRGEKFRLILGDFRKEMLSLDPGSIDVIITDPPYPEEYLPLYNDLARLATEVLRPGGSLIVMSGQYHLPKIISMMVQHLNYQWVLAYLTPGGQSPQIWPRKVNTFWKPLLWFVKGTYNGDWVGDVCKSEVNDNDKRFHNWGQSESGMADIIERFTLPGDLILDPFCGGGTTGTVSLQLNRRFIGIDKDQTAIEITAQRIMECLK